MLFDSPKPCNSYTHMYLKLFNIFNKGYEIDYLTWYQSGVRIPTFIFKCCS